MTWRVLEYHDKEDMNGTLLSEHETEREARKAAKVEAEKRSIPRTRSWYWITDDKERAIMVSERS